MSLVTDMKHLHFNFFYLHCEANEVVFSLRPAWWGMSVQRPVATPTGNITTAGLWPQTRCHIYKSKAVQPVKRRITVLDCSAPDTTESETRGKKTEAGGVISNCNVSCTSNQTQVGVTRRKWCFQVKRMRKVPACRHLVSRNAWIARAVLSDTNQKACTSTSNYDTRSLPAPYWVFGLMLVEVNEMSLDNIFTMFADECEMLMVSVEDNVEHNDDTRKFRVITRFWTDMDTNAVVGMVYRKLGSKAALMSIISVYDWNGALSRMSK